MDTHQIGRRFEEVAGQWLERRGWTIVDRNVRFRRREIDLVIRRGNLVAFVEVKGRRGDRRGDPLEAITPFKRREIEGVARWWVAHHGVAGESYRFDAVAVRVRRAEGGVVTEVEHVEDAWRMGV